MEVTLRKRSWHYALNKWSLEKDPQFWSLCPYFWLTLYHIITSPFRAFGRYLIFRPVEWIFVPRGERSWESSTQRKAYASERISKVNAFLEKTETVFRRILSAIILTIFIGGFLGMLVMGVYKDGWGLLLELLSLMGLAIIIALAIGGITWLFSKFQESDTWNALKGMFYSIKNKVCPGINWRENNQNV
jgi:ABC-type multidrug transport system fused ATPase/permease subunit